MRETPAHRFTRRASSQCLEYRLRGLDIRRVRREHILAVAAQVSKEWVLGHVIVIYPMRRA